MKKLFVVLVAAFIAVSANAQWYVGGGLGIGANKEGNTWFISPEGGYNFSDKFAVGASLGFSGNKASEYSSGFNFNFNPYARYTFLHAGRFSAFVDGALSFSLFSATYRGAGEPQTSSDFNFGLGINPGVALSITDHFSVLAHVGTLGWNTGEGFQFGVSSHVSTLSFYYVF